MKIHVDTERCTGHGVCESLAPEVFEVGSQGLVQVLVESPGEDRRAVLEEAVAECPTQSLRLEG